MQMTSIRLTLTLLLTFAMSETKEVIKVLSSFTSEQVKKSCGKIITEM